MAQAKQALVRFPGHQWAEEDDMAAPDEGPIEFVGAYRGNRQGRLHVEIDPPLDQGFLDKKARVIIPHSFSKEYRGRYVGDDEEGNAVFGDINREH